MNDAIYAIPGLMPPTAPNWRSKLKAPEDGSLLMLLHAGDIADEVSYAVHVRGACPGVIKDPDYKYAGKVDSTCRQLPAQALTEAKDVDGWPDFMTVTSTLPDNIIIPRRVCCNCPIPISQLPELQDIDTVWYWVLALPERALPVGDTKIEVSVNGRVHAYIVQRPAFDIHRPDSITVRYKAYAPVYATAEDHVTANVSATKAGMVTADLQGLLAKYPELPLDQLVFSITFVEGNREIIQQGTQNGTSVIFNIDPLHMSGAVSWRIEYRREDRQDAWLPLASSVVYL